MIRVMQTGRKEHYIPMLEHFWGEFKEHVNLDEEEQGFQQDSVLPHTTNITMTWLHEKFGEHLMSYKVEVE